MNKKIAMKIKIKINISKQLQMKTIKNKLIYFQSPVGKGLIGKNKNDLVEIKTDDTTVTVKGT